jgi:hypothetical protein
MADNTQLNQATTTGDLVRSLEDADGVKWYPGLAAFATTIGTPDVLAIVTPTAGLPVHQQTGATWAVSLASAPLPTGAATAANQASELTALALLHTDLTATLTVSVSGAVAVTGTFWQATQPVSAASLPLPTGAATATLQSAQGVVLDSIDARLAGTVVVGDGGGSLTVDGTFWQATQPVSLAALPSIPAGTNNIGDVDVLTLPAVTIAAAQTLAAVTSITNVVHVDDNGGSITVDGAVAATQSGTWNVTNVSGTVSLPTGASTSAKQDTGNTSVASIDTKTPALGQALAGASVPVVLTAAQLSTLTPLATVAVTGVATAANQATVIASLASIDGHVDGVEGSLSSIDAKITAVNTGAVVVSSSALPTGASTAARQDTANTSLGSLDAKAPALGQALAAASVPVVLPAAQITTLTPPAAITGFATSAKQDTGNASVASIDGKVTACNTGAVVLAAGTAAVGKLAANSGVTIGAVEIAAAQTLAAVTAITNVVHVDDNAGSLTVDGTVAASNLPATVDTNSGNKSASTIRVVLATDQPALTNKLLVTPDSVALPANQSVNASQVNGVTPLMGNGVTGTGSPRVTLASDGTAISTAGFMSVKIDQTTPGTTNAVQDLPGTSGGLSISRVLSAASTNGTSVKASAGQVYAITAFNTNAAVRYLKLYNKASAPTVGTDTPVLTFAIPGNTAGAGFVINIDKGIAFGTGIALAITTGIADADTGAVAANELVVNTLYK